MKHVVVLMDGVADRPFAGLGGRTPLEAAVTPHLDRLCGAGSLATLRTGPASLPMGSDVGNMTVLGYDPGAYYGGRAPLEALALGIRAGEDEVVFRANLVHVEDGRMDDYSGGHMDTEDGRILIGALDQGLGGPGLRFTGGTQYRHIALFRAPALAEAKCTPPHDITGKDIAGSLPDGPGAEELRRVMEASRPILEGHPVNLKRRGEGKKTGNMVWLWGQGRLKPLPAFSGRWGVKGAVITAVDLIRGLGRAAGLDVIEVPGATGWLDSDFKGKAAAALKALETRDFVYVHLEATDEAGHKGDAAAKVKAVELIDEQVLGTLADGLRGREWRLLVTPDHATPLETRTHAYDPVPYFIYDSRRDSRERLRYTEAAAAACGRLRGGSWNLMAEFLNRPPLLEPWWEAK